MRFPLAPLLALALAGCSASDRPAEWASVREVTPSFLGAGSSRDPSLAADSHGRVALSFVSDDRSGKNLWLSVSRDGGLTFSAPSRVNPRDNSVDSYPESRPLVTFGPGGELAVAWSEKRADTSGAVDLVVRASGDGGATLGPLVVINDDREAPPLGPTRGRGSVAARSRHAGTSAAWNPRAFHGLPALAYFSDGSLFATWLDGREDQSREPEPPYATLYYSTSPDGGQSWGANRRLADSVCSCCRPTALTDPTGRVAVAYRAAAGDLRDPALAVSFDRGASFVLDTVVSADRWLLRGCPAQGPALSWNRLVGGHYAWFTGAPSPTVYLMPWHADHGAAGVKRPLMDSLASARSPRLAGFERGGFVAVEARPLKDTTRTVVAIRALDPDGSMTPWIFLGVHASASGIAALDHRVALAAWIEREGERSRVRVARLTRRGGRR